MPTNAIELLKSHSLPMLIEEEIQRVILKGEYAPGDRINEKELVLRFGTSRGPIREALRSLESSGLIEQIPNRGVFVRKLSAAEAANMYDVRAVLFALAGRLMAMRATPEEIARLRGFAQAMDEAIARGDVEAYLRGNFALHEFIVTHAGNPVLASQYLSLIKQLRLYRTRNLMLPESMRASNDEHHEMIDAIAAHDPERAASTHLNHVATAKQRLMATPNIA
ncbi:FCD domain-containing protein [Bosea sp. 117]|uniref:FCD domain-containing protein n=1 Tax=Bosea sp. 117 TaxID=1125973 RepID=UPI0004944C4E|nr:FCD domain-containing protein [Bosea sp. 117]